MVTLQEVENQLKRIGVSFRFWGRTEMLELRNILIPGEKIQACINGRWVGGFAMLCATDQRILLIDKKPMYLALEDIRYDMISEVDYSYRLLNATVRICTPNKDLAFLGWNTTALRALANYVQQRVMEVRQQHMFQQTLQTAQQSQEKQMASGLQPVAESGSGFATFPLPGSTGASQVLPTNPYTNNPLMTRRRAIGKFRR